MGREKKRSPERYERYIEWIKVGECEVVFNVLILAECKYSYNLDFLAFESKDKYFPAFPVIFVGERARASVC